MNLTPEQLAVMNSWVPAQHPEANYSSFPIINGVMYQPQIDGGQGAEFGGTQNAWIGYDPVNHGVGTQYTMHNNDGTFARTGTMMNGNDPSMLLKAALAAGAMYFGVPALMGAGGAGAGGLEALAAMEGGAGAGLTAEGLGAAGAVGGTALPGLADAAVGGGLGTGAAGAGTGAAGGLSSLLSGKNAGLLATGLGALAGSQGTQKASTETKSMPEWLMPYITGQGGLLNLTQNQLQRSQSPEALAGWQNIAQKGQGLLSMPVAGNGYAARYGSR